MSDPVPEDVEFTNQGKEWHHFIGFPIKGDATIDEVRKELEKEEGPPKTVDQEAGIETTVLNGGIAQVASPELKPGRWAFFCFVSDRGGGPPHVAKGMASEITVTE